MSEADEPFSGLFVLAAVSGRILHVSLPEAQVRVLHEHAGDFPDGVTVAGTSLWWTTMGAPSTRPGFTGEAALDFGARNGAVHQLDLHTGEARTVINGGVVTTPKQIAHAGEFLYWADREGGSVERYHASTRQVDRLVSTPRPEDPMDQCVGVAVDNTAGWLYWTQKGPSDGGRGRIFRRSLGDRTGNPVVLWDNLPEPIDLELHDGFLYWTDRGSPPAGNTLNRGRVTTIDGAVEPVQIIASGFGEAIGIAVDSHSETVYVSALDGTIRAVSLSEDDRTDRLLVAIGEPVTGIAGFRSDAGLA